MDVDCKIKIEALNSENNEALLLPDIKIEKDHPELITDCELLINKIKKENDVEQDVKLTIKENHACSVCGEEFPEIKYLQVHEAIHDPKLECPACERAFKSQKHFILHIQTHIQNPLKCKHCPEIFLDKRSHNLHLYSHKKIKKHTCGYCLKELSNKRSLQAHIRGHRNEKPFSCEVCGKAFIQERVLKSHIVDSHSGKVVNKEKLTCEICNGTYSSKSSLTKHTRKVHATGKTFPCKICGETFLNYQQMRDHKINTHPGKIYCRICPLCSKEFYCRRSFIKHQHMHVEPGKEIDRTSYVTPIDCYLCGEQMFGRKAFTKHQQEHLLMTDDELNDSIKIKKFNCKVCAKVFHFKRNLFRHMDMHLDKTFKCSSHCSEKFTYLGIRLHKEWYFDKYQCSECNETFVGKKNFKKHHRIHRAPIKFTCKICGLEVRNKQLLISHWKMRHNIKCHLCHKKFVTHLPLTKHIRIKHKTSSEDSGTTEKISSEKKVILSILKKAAPIYHCKICKRSFNTQLKHEDHMKLHKKKCFQCDNCKKNFIFLKNFMFHIKQNICLKYYDNKIGPNQFNCMLCKREYNTLDSLMVHMRLHTTILKCKFCNSKFKQKDLQEHINRAHPGEAKFSCDKCSLRFSSVNDLVKHKKYFHRMILVKCEKEQVIVEPVQEVNSVEIEDNKSFKEHSVWLKKENICEKLEVVTEPVWDANSEEVEDKFVNEHLVSLKEEPKLS